MPCILHGKQIFEVSVHTLLFALLRTGLKKVDMGGFQHADTKNLVSFSQTMWFLSLQQKFNKKPQEITKTVIIFPSWMSICKNRRGALTYDALTTTVTNGLWRKHSGLHTALPTCSLSPLPLPAPEVCTAVLALSRALLLSLPSAWLFSSSVWHLHIAFCEFYSNTF